MADAGGGTSGVTIEADDAVVRVDVRPHGLVAQLRSQPDAPTTVVAQCGDRTGHRSLGAGIRQSSFRITESVTVEASPGSDFAAVSHPDGRCLVVAFSGDVVVHPSGEDRFALAAHEALLVPPSGAPGEVKVMATESLSAETQGQVTEMVEHAASLIATPIAPATPPAADTAPPAEPAAIADTPPAAEKPDTAAAAADSEKKRKKTKRERREEKAARAAAARAARKKEEDAAAAAAAGAAATASEGETPAKETARPPKETGKKRPPRPSPTKKAAPDKRAAEKRAAAKPAAERRRREVAGAGAGGVAADDPVGGRRSKRGVYVAVGAVALLVLVAVLLVVPDDGDQVATIDPTTTLAPATTASPETTAVATTAPPTTATPTTATPTTAAPPVARYDFVPQSCVQEGSTITYTATITNNASAPFDFVVEVAFKDSGGDTITTDEVTVTELPPGATETISASGSVGRDVSGTGATCTVDRVEATASA